MVCGFSGESAPGRMQDAQDEDVLNATDRHIEHRMKREAAQPLTEDSELRSRLLHELETLCDRHADWALGRLVFHLASLAHISEYDIEDEELLSAAKSMRRDILVSSMAKCEAIQSSTEIP